MRLARLLCFALLTLLTACASTPPARQPIQPPAPLQPAPSYRPAAPQAPATGMVVLNTAREMLGTPYRYGGTTPNGFDCSGLVKYSYQRAGIQVPRSSSEQYRFAAKVPVKQLQSGDLLFFRLQPPKVSHVGIYDRNGRFIHAPSSGKSVSYASLDNPYWRRHLIAAGRFR
jgi:cell wall-associated NlpC family hydrolase